MKWYYFTMNKTETTLTPILSPRSAELFIQTYLSYMSLSTDLFIYMRCFFGPLSFSILKRKMTCTQLEAVRGTAAPVGARILPFLYGKWVHRTHEEKQPCKFSLHIHCTGRMSCWSTSWRNMWGPFRSCGTGHRLTRRWRSWRDRRFFIFIIYYLYGGTEGGGRKQQVHRLSLRGQRVWEEAYPGQRPLMKRQKAHLSSGRWNARRTVRIQREPSKNSAGTWEIFLSAPSPATYLINVMCKMKDAALIRLREELVRVRGPLPEDGEDTASLSSQDTARWVSQNSEFDL